MAAKDLLAWIEIPVADFERALKFYRNAMMLKIEVRLLNGERHGIFFDEDGRARGSIVETKEMNENGKGPVIFFRARYDISSMEEKVVKDGGKISVKKTLIKNSGGQNVSKIPLNLIDGQVGYFALFTDTEGNKLAFYGNS